MRHGFLLLLACIVVSGLMLFGCGNSSDNDVDDLNEPPLAEAGPNQSVNTGTLVTLDGSASSDADGDPLMYDWLLTAVPTGSTATLSDETISQPTFTADSPGTYTAELIVHDGLVASLPDEVTITASAAGFTPPSGYAQINFKIDDTSTPASNPGYAWKGSFGFDPATRILTYDGSWTGPYPVLYDDGPWQMGGHEPDDATAGDNIWGVSVWFDAPSSNQIFEYGAISGSVNGSDGTWIWIGSNGVFTVMAGSTTTVNATGLTLP